VFVGSTGANQVMRADTITGPLSYNPSTCALTLGATSASITVGATTGVITVGTTMGTINVGTGATGVINLGATAGGYITNTSGDINLSSNYNLNVLNNASLTPTILFNGTTAVLNTNYLKMMSSDNSTAYYVFNKPGTVSFTANAGVAAQYWVVGGGGKGGSGYGSSSASSSGGGGGGGGGGRVISGTLMMTSGVAYTGAVGAGGSSGAGSSSFFQGITASGGSAGGNGVPSVSGVGGSTFYAGGLGGGSNIYNPQALGSAGTSSTVTLSTSTPLKLSGGGGGGGGLGTVAASNITGGTGEGGGGGGGGMRNGIVVTNGGSGGNAGQNAYYYSGVSYGGDGGAGIYGGGGGGGGCAIDNGGAGNPHVGGVGGIGGDGTIVISVPNNLKVSISPYYDQAYISCSNVDITVVPKTTLNVTGALTATGAITGSSFVGDGSALTGIDNMNIVDTNTSGTFYPVFVGSTGAGQTMCTDATTGPLSYVPSTATLSLSNLTATGTISGATFVGDGSALTGINNMNIVDINTSGTYYPVFVGSTGAGQTMCADTITGPLSYNPASCALTLGAPSASMTVGATSGTITVGTTLGTINVGTGSTGVINLGGAGGGIINNTTGEITINGNLNVTGKFEQYSRDEYLTISSATSISLTSNSSNTAGGITYYQMLASTRTVMLDFVAFPVLGGLGTTQVPFRLPTDSKINSVTRFYKTVDVSGGINILIPTGHYYQNLFSSGSGWTLSQNNLTAPTRDAIVTTLNTNWRCIEICKTARFYENAGTTTTNICWMIMIIS